MCVCVCVRAHVWVLSYISSTSVWVLVVLSDLFQVLLDIGLKNSRAGEEPGQQAEQLPALGTVGSVEATIRNSNKFRSHFAIYVL